MLPLRRGLVFRKSLWRSSCFDLNCRSFGGQSIRPEQARGKSIRSVKKPVVEEVEVGSPRWSIVHRPILETLLKSYAQHPTVVQPMILHGPRGVGKRTVIERLIRNWSKCPHISEYVDFKFNDAIPPWTMCPIDESPAAVLADDKVKEATFTSLTTFRSQLEQGLELLAQKAVEIGNVESDHILEALLERHSVDGALSQFLRVYGEGSARIDLTSPKSTNDMWKESIQIMRQENKGLGYLHDSLTSKQGQGGSGNQNPLHKAENVSKEETFLSLALAKNLLKIQEEWRVSVGACLKGQGIMARASADVASSWAVLLLHLLSFAVKEGHFQPKLVINNIDLMRKAASDSSRGSVNGALYHDSLLMHMRSIGVHQGCIPIILVSSDSYYSCKLFADHGDDISFISQEALGWTPKEAAVHLVPAIFEESEWNVITSVLGSSARHLAELHSIWHNPAFLDLLEDSTGNSMEDCIDLYLGYLQVTAVDPAMAAAINILEKFAEDLTIGKTSRMSLRHGAAWRYPPKSHSERHQWAKIQLLDYVQALADTEFAVNHRDPNAVDLLEDPSTDALLQVGLLYQQKELPYIRPITRGISRCLVRWHVKERLKLSSVDNFKYYWHRLVRGRYYKQLMVV